MMSINSPASETNPDIASAGQSERGMSKS